MSSNYQILLSGRSQPELQALETMLRKQPNVDVSTRFLVNGSVDVLQGRASLPDLLIHYLGENGEGELKALMARPSTSRPAMLMIGAEGEPRLMRLAMQAGARDFFTRPVVAEEILLAVRKAVAEKLAERGENGCRMTAVINAKGGSGASLIAANLAHIMTTHAGLQVALVDLDLQFGNQALNLDLNPNKGIVDALEVVETLDVVAVQGYMTKHEGGLQLLSTLADQIVLPGEVSDTRLGQLLDILRQSFEHLVIDLPRIVDPTMSLVMEQATRIVVVMQQNLSNLRDAKRMMQIMREELGISNERMIVAVNRYSERSPVSLDDVEKALQSDSLFIIPNDFKQVTAAANLGAPLWEYAPHAQVTRALVKLANEVSGELKVQKSGFIGQLISRFSHGV